MKTKVDLNRILYFVTVVESGSYTKAALRLGVPKSTLSRNIQALEDDVNLRLLNRSTRKLSLTKAGEHYFESCAPLMEDLQKAQTQILDYQQDVKGRLKITMAAELGTAFLVNLLPKFMNRYPKIELEFDFSTTNHDLVESGFDLAIRVGNKLDDSSYIARRIASPNLGLFASPKYLQNHAAITKLDDLKQHQHILLNLSEGYLYFENQESFLREKHQLSSNSMAFNKIMCLQDIGIAVLPPLICQHEIKTGQLLPVLPNLALEKPNMFAVYPSRNHPSKALTTFIEYLHREIQQIEGLQ